MWVFQKIPVIGIVNVKKKKEKKKEKEDPAKYLQEVSQPFVSMSNILPNSPCGFHLRDPFPGDRNGNKEPYDPVAEEIMAIIQVREDFLF